jgi:hemoglobin-like flavoprotein
MSVLNPKLISKLCRSLPLVEPRKDEIITRMEVMLRGAAGPEEPFGQSELSAMTLVEMLCRNARCIMEQRRFAPALGVAQEHQRLGIDGRTYSRFGDAITAILHDVIGPRLPSDVSAAWCDLFWTVINEITAREPVDA